MARKRQRCCGGLRGVPDILRVRHLLNGASVCGEKDVGDGEKDVVLLGNDIVLEEKGVKMRKKISARS